MRKPASSNAGGAARILTPRRISRGRWCVIDYSAEQAEFVRLQACEDFLSTLRWFERRFDERQTKPKRPPTRAQQLRRGLEAGRFCPPNAAALLADLDRAQAGDRKAQSRVVCYLETPGVLEALEALDG